MEQEKSVIGEKENTGADSFLDQTISALPRLNLRRLESLQRLLQYASVLVLLIFIVLIAVSYFKLDGLYEESKLKRNEIDRRNAALANLSNTITDQENVKKKNQEIIDNQAKENERLKKEYAAQQKAFALLPEDQKKQVEKEIEDIANKGNSKQAPGWIFIQIADEKQRPRATEILRLLKKEGLIVPGIENVGDKAPAVSQLRTCGKKDDNTTGNDLTRLANTLKSLKVALDEPRFLSNCGKTNSRQYELWFGKNF